ncbi:SRPBCC family protein [Bosea sp. 2YAB26]|uniref:SRPBCC family protein n=1 Tax=Bosea sp. 2YAB26 TaxID=3237478 RepID=UPI003F8E2191
MLSTLLWAIVAILALAIVVVLVLAAMKPDSFRVQRSLAINAPPEHVFPLINGVRSWGDWSPWEKKDPAMKRSFSGAESGLGAVYAWDGDKNVGQGRMEIVEASAPRKVGLRLDFIKPFEAHNDVTFALEPRGGATEVIWTMTGPAPFLTRIMHVFFNVDRMVGRDFETGLANLQVAAER